MPSLRLFITSAVSLAALSSASAFDPAEFATPPNHMRPHPLWFWNNSTVTAAGVQEQMQQCKTADGYGGFGILPFGGGFTPKYLTEDYFTLYGVAAAKAKELDMKLCIYDEYGYPSGSGGASHGDGIPRFANAFPNDTIKRLDKIEQTVTGPTTVTRSLPAGTLMAIVAMNTATGERIDLTSTAATFTWAAPSGTWKLMFFVCVKDGDPNVDYLSPEACDKHIGMTHQQYYNRMSSYFGKGNTVDGVFFDETTMYRAQGRIWTGDFNTKFQAKYGTSPTLLYPALWYDIGADTASARNRLFGLRAELYAMGYAKRVQDWCDAHGDLYATGHQDQEEIVNPCNVSGDLMKCFRYQDIPGIDKIGGTRPTEKFYKVVSSAANNWDKDRVMSETYGDMGNISMDTLYRVAMDQYTKGVNIDHPPRRVVDTGAVTYLPELSYRNPLYASSLPAYTRFIARLNLMLQGGRHVADIGMLYPIATLQAGNYLDGPLGNYEGGVTIPEADYHNVGSILSDTLCRDFTFLHPDTIDERCTVSGEFINLENEVNYERSRVFIMPGSKTIGWSTLQKIKAFYDNGGKVIATRQLPSQSAEPGHDADVVATISEMFPVVPAGVVTTASSAWAAGGYDGVLATDSLTSTRWNAADGSGGNQWLEVDFGAPKTFQKTIIRESFNRITSYEIRYWDGTQWLACATGTTAGAIRTNTFTPVTASRMRLYIKTINSDSVSINEFEVYDSTGINLATGGRPTIASNAAGGKTYFINTATAANLKEALDDAHKVYDVELENDAVLQCIHKVKDGRHIWYFANLGTTAVDTWARLRGNFTPQLWNADTGIVNTTPETSSLTEEGHAVTRVRVSLAAGKSIFIVAPRANSAGASLEVAPGETEVALHLKNLTSDSRYLIEKSTDLQDWSVFLDFVAPPAAGSAVVTTATHTDPARHPAAFYRLGEKD